MHSKPCVGFATALTLQLFEKPAAATGHFEQN